MIRNIPSGAEFSFRRRLGSGASSAAGLSSLATAGISAGVGLAASAIQDWLQHNQINNMGKSGATAVANAMAQQLHALRTAYLAEVNPSCADQRAALDAFDAAMVWFQSPAGCGNSQFGSAGDRCIAERVNPGAIYSYVDEFRAPIASDPRVTGCNTGQAVYLPNLQTGGFENIGITSGPPRGGSTPADLVNAAITNAPATMQSTEPNYLLYGAAAIAAFILAKSL